MRSLFAPVLLASAGSTSPLLDLAVNTTDGSYSVSIDGAPWFPGGATAVWHNGTLFSSADGTLTITSAETFAGEDTMGAFAATELAWTGGGGAVGLHTQFKAYAGYIIFEQRNGPATLGGSGDKDGVATVFPSFRVTGADAAAGTPTRGALGYTGDMVGAGYQSFEWTEGAAVPFGVNAGPLCVFAAAPAGAAGTAAVLSPAYNFMAAQQSYSAADSTLDYGVMGSVDGVPAGFSVQTIVAASAAGVNNAMMAWGDALLHKYGKGRAAVDDDLTLNYLGYSTDNGAFYYYYTEPGTNYETTILDVKAYADEVGLPYRHWLADSYWYFKGDKNGVKNWTAMPELFPRGLEYVTNATGWEIVGHNRYWSDNTDYATQNGGEYEFAIDATSQYAVPLTQAFWDDLMESSKKWGLSVYEQDWLDSEYDNVGVLHTNATLARTWLMQMGTAAQKHGLTIQCALLAALPASCPPPPRYPLAY